MNARANTEREIVEEHIKVEQKRRRCLMCGEMFDSFGPGNRICKKCKSKQAWRSGA
ncbi:hypothetical protein [Nitratireductor sp. XY-223]|uniref:hypothetical protein n=1 Tax=Nitratireductor sp. XY-223 TaxID=2561926 RepID=UPI00145A9D11|nr:hypothetical protein [Nitratireductor sp. XY-223]